MDEYKTISKDCSGSFKDKGSKFLAFGFPVSNVNEIKEHNKNLKKKYHDARHHCYAYRLEAGDSAYRMNDDGEPSGTAGKPIYGRIVANGLSNVLIVVVRYFGGTLLGASGLIRAYKAAAEDCINNANTVVRTIDVDFTISFRYEQINSVMRIVKEFGIKIKHQKFGTTCTVGASIRRNSYEKISGKLMKIEDLRLIVN